MRPIRNVFFLLVLLASCRTPKEKLSTLFGKYPEEAREVSFQFFPPTEKITTNTIYTEGETKIVNEGFIVDCDTLPRVPTTTGGTKQTFKCPPSYYRVDTFRKDSIIREQDNRLVGMLTNENKGLRDNLSASKQQVKTRNGLIGLLSALLLGCGFIIYVKSR